MRVICLILMLSVSDAFAEQKARCDNYTKTDVAYQDIHPAVHSVVTVLFPSKNVGAEQEWTMQSGFIYGDEKYVITNAHGIEHMQTISKKDQVLVYVLLSDSECSVREGVVVAARGWSNRLTAPDVAAIRIGDPPAALKGGNLTSLEDGSKLTALFPAMRHVSLPKKQLHSGTMEAQGIVLGKVGAVHEPLPLLQFSEGLRQGRSGSPLLNERMEVVGMVSVVRVRVSDGAPQKTYAVPIELINVFMEENELR